MAKTVRMTWTVNSASTALSMCHIAAGDLAVGDTIETRYFDVRNDIRSGAKFVVSQVRSSPIGTSVGSFAYGGSLGGIIEGVNYRFAIVVEPGSRVDLRQLGVACIEGVTGWHSRFAAIVEWAKNAGVMLTGQGVASCTETVFVDRAFCDFRLLRFQGGTAALTAGVVGTGTFYTTAQSNRAVTFTTGTPVTVNMDSHGLSAGDTFMFGTNGKLPGALTVLTTYYVASVVDVNSFTISTSLGGSVVAATTAGSGTFYLWQGGTQTGVVTHDIVEYSGKVRRLGIVVRAANNGSNREFLNQTLLVWGDGNSDRTTTPTCIGVRHEADDSPNAEYCYVTNYCYIGLGIYGPSEKHSLRVSGIYCRHFVYNLPGSSADTLRVRMHGANHQAFYTEAEGADTSLALDLSCEARDDPALDAGADSPHSPAIWIRNGKATTLSGEIRSNNGELGILISARTNASGASLRVGADTVHFRGWRMVHGYGHALRVENCRYVAGDIFIKNWGNPNGSGQAAAAAVFVGRIVSASGLFVTGEAITNVYGVQFGDDFWYSREAHLGHYAIDMGTVIQWNTDGTERTGSNGAPTTFDAWHVYKSKKCLIDMQGTRGRGIIAAAVSEGTTVIVDHLAGLYPISKHGSAVATVGIPTLSASGLTIS